MVLAQNDYRNGDGSCGFDYSLDGGKKFGDGLLPESFTAPGFVAPRHYWDASGDPVVAFDSEGYAYYACLQFNRGVTSDLGGDHSGIFVYRSANGGASWTFPGDPVVQDDGLGEVGLNDKEWMTVDTSPDSPFQDRCVRHVVEVQRRFHRAGDQRVPQHRSRRHVVGAGRE